MATATRDHCYYSRHERGQKYWFAIDYFDQLDILSAEPTKTSSLRLTILLTSLSTRDGLQLNTFEQLMTAACPSIYLIAYLFTKITQYYATVSYIHRN